MKNIRFTYRALFLIPLLTLSYFKTYGQVDTHKSVIDSKSGILTVINVIEPKDVEQEVILEYLQKGITETMRYQKGFISANIHKSLDSNDIIVYAQWKDKESPQNAVKLIEEGGAPNMLYVFGHSTPNYHPYEVISVNLANERR